MGDRLSLRRSARVGPFDCGRLAYGCWRFETAERSAIREKLEAALSIGANLIDTADVYGPVGAFGDTEERLGAVLAEADGLRDRIVLATKGGVRPPVPYDSRREYLVAACEASLRRLRVETIDLYFVHRPDLLASHDEVAEALTRLLQAGKIREAGVSNYSVAQTRALASRLDFALAATQPEISALSPGAMLDGTLDLAQEMALAPMAWSPLGGGRLFAPHDARSEETVAELDRIAAENDTSREAAAFAWLMAHPAEILPILGSTNPARIRSAAAAYDVTMTRRDWYAVLEASLGQPMP